MVDASGPRECRATIESEWRACEVNGCMNPSRPASPTARTIADRIGIEVERDAALAEVERLRGIIAEAAAIHVDAGDSQGFTAEGYRVIDSCCGECGIHGEYGYEWPCDTAKALAKVAPHDR